MNKRNEIIKIYTSQKYEISLLSNKITQLENNNLFLMQFIDKDSSLPCSISDLEQENSCKKNKEIIGSVLDNALLDIKVKSGFVKFTALIKGYIVRTLLEAEKVRCVIVTIKDTAKLALTIRHERVSGDCAQLGDNINGRDHQEGLSFQKKLLSQLKHALEELHEIFFIWPSYYQINLLKNHINQILTLDAKHQEIDNNGIQGTSGITIVKAIKPAPLSSATVKRRQRMAIRNNLNGNIRRSEDHLLPPIMRTGSQVRNQLRGNRSSLVYMAAGDIQLGHHPRLRMDNGRMQPVENLDPISFLIEEAQSERSQSLSSTHFLRTLSQIRVQQQLTVLSKANVMLIKQYQLSLINLQNRTFNMNNNGCYISLKSQQENFLRFQQVDMKEKQLQSYWRNKNKWPMKRPLKIESAINGNLRLGYSQSIMQELKLSIQKDTNLDFLRDENVSKYNFCKFNNRISLKWYIFILRFYFFTSSYVVVFEI